MTNRYVVGFLFSADRSKVVVIRKNRPRRQAGKFNGVGGSIEWPETAAKAMEREFQEETGVLFEGWERFAVQRVHGPDRLHIIHCFRGFSDLALDARTQTDEQVLVVKTAEIWGLPTVYSDKWLIPLALDNDLKQPVLVDLHTERAAGAYINDSGAI